MPDAEATLDEVKPVQTQVNLNPTHAPGRANRKARAFATEIIRLHGEGYTFEQIRGALADASVIVSRSTVQREVARLYVRARPAARSDSLDSLDVLEQPWPQSSELSVFPCADAPQAASPLAYDKSARLDDTLESFFARIKPDSISSGDAVISPKRLSWRGAIRTIVRSTAVAASKMRARLTHLLRR